MATDSFVVLRNIELVVNDVLTRYPTAMVQVCQLAGQLELYRLRGPMDVYLSTRSSKEGLMGAAGGLRYGLAGAVFEGATRAMLADNSGQFKE